MKGKKKQKKGLEWSSLPSIEKDKLIYVHWGENQLYSSTI